MGIKMTAGGIDWAHYEAKAASMTDEALHYARLDCDATARLWDGATYEYEAAKAGHYRDEGSVYRAEQLKRSKARDAEARKAAALGTLEDLV